MTKERFDQLAGAAEKIAKIEDQQEQSDRQQRRDWERQIYKEADEEERKRTEVEINELQYGQLNPIVQENLRMAKEFREEKRGHEQYMASLLNEIAKYEELVRVQIQDIGCAKILCSIYFNIASGVLGDNEVRKRRDAELIRIKQEGGGFSIGAICKCGQWEVEAGHNPACELVKETKP